MSGAESPKEPNNGVCLGFTCFPAPKNKAGSKENALANAKNAIGLGLDNETISKITGLSVEEIEKTRKC